MAVGKEAPIPACCAAAAATREALAAAVAELTETLASLPATTIKRRLRDVEIVLPNGTAFENSLAAASDGFSSPHAKIEGITPSKPIEGLEKK
jgi:hypothetical protein